MRTAALALALGLALAAGLRAEGAPEPATPAARAAWGESGLEYRFSLGALSVFNGSPMSYTPFELGWRFANGLRVRTGLEIFYYEGQDKDAKQPALGVEKYSYDMVNWRTGLLYVVPLPLRLRPVAGLTLDAVRGERRRSVPGVVNPPKIEAWGFMGPGALLGAEFRGGPNWALSLTGRYSFSFSEVGPMAAADLGWHYLF